MFLLCAHKYEDNLLDLTCTFHRFKSTGRLWRASWSEGRTASNLCLNFILYQATRYHISWVQHHKHVFTCIIKHSKKNENIVPLTGGGGVQQSPLGGQSGHGAAAAHVGTVPLHLGFSSGRGIHTVLLVHHFKSARAPVLLGLSQIRDNVDFCINEEKRALI